MGAIERCGSFRVRENAAPLKPGANSPASLAARASFRVRENAAPLKPVGPYVRQVISTAFPRS